MFEKEKFEKFLNGSIIKAETKSKTDIAYFRKWFAMTNNDPHLLGTRELEGGLVHENIDFILEFLTFLSENESVDSEAVMSVTKEEKREAFPLYQLDQDTVKKMCSKFKPMAAISQEMTKLSLRRFEYEKINSRSPDTDRKQKEQYVALNDFLVKPFFDKSGQYTDENCKGFLSIKQVLQQMAENKRDALQEIEIPLIFRGKQGGHALSCSFKRVEKDGQAKIVFLVGNTGAGLEYHQMVPKQNKLYHCPVLAYEIPASDFLKQPVDLERFLMGLFLPHLEKTWKPQINEKLSGNHDQKTFYDGAINALTVYFPSAKLAENQLEYTKDDSYVGAGQHSGSCSEKSLHNLMEDICGDKLKYKLFIYSLKKYSILKMWATYQSEKPSKVEKNTNLSKSAQAAQALKNRQAKIDIHQMNLAIKNASRILKKIKNKKGSNEEGSQEFKEKLNQEIQNLTELNLRVLDEEKSIQKNTHSSQSENKNSGPVFLQSLARIGRTDITNNQAMQELCTDFEIIQCVEGESTTIDQKLEKFLLALKEKQKKTTSVFLLKSIESYFLKVKLPLNSNQLSTADARKFCKTMQDIRQFYIEHCQKLYGKDCDMPVLKAVNLSMFSVSACVLDQHFSKKYPALLSKTEKTFSAPLKMQLRAALHEQYQGNPFFASESALIDQRFKELKQWLDASADPVTYPNSKEASDQAVSRYMAILEARPELKKQLENIYEQLVKKAELDNAQHAFYNTTHRSGEALKVPAKLQTYQYGPEYQNIFVKALCALLEYKRFNGFDQIYSCTEQHELNKTVVQEADPRRIDSCFIEKNGTWVVANGTQKVSSAYDDGKNSTAQHFENDYNHQLKGLDIDEVLQEVCLQEEAEQLLANFTGDLYAQQSALKKRNAREEQYGDAEYFSGNQARDPRTAEDDHGRIRIITRQIPLLNFETRSACSSSKATVRFGNTSSFHLFEHDATLHRLMTPMTRCVAFLDPQAPAFNDARVKQEDSYIYSSASGVQQKTPILAPTVVKGALDCDYAKVLEVCKLQAWHQEITANGVQVNTVANRKGQSFGEDILIERKLYHLRKSPHLQFITTIEYFNHHIEDRLFKGEDEYLIAHLRYNLFEPGILIDTLEQYPHWFSASDENRLSKFFGRCFINFQENGRPSLKSLSCLQIEIQTYKYIWQYCELNPDFKGAHPEVAEFANTQFKRLQNTIDNALTALEPGTEPYDRCHYLNLLLSECILKNSKTERINQKIITGKFCSLFAFKAREPKVPTPEARLKAFQRTIRLENIEVEHINSDLLNAFKNIEDKKAVVEAILNQQLGANHDYCLVPNEDFASFPKVRIQRGTDASIIIWVHLNDGCLYNENGLACTAFPERFRTDPLIQMICEGNVPTKVWKKPVENQAHYFEFTYSGRDYRLTFDEKEKAEPLHLECKLLVDSEKMKYDWCSYLDTIGIFEQSKKPANFSERKKPSQLIEKLPKTLTEPGNHFWVDRDNKLHIAKTQGKKPSHSIYSLLDTKKFPAVNSIEYNLVVMHPDASSEAAAAKWVRVLYHDNYYQSFLERIEDPKFIEIYAFYEKTFLEGYKDFSPPQRIFIKLPRYGLEFTQKWGALFAVSGLKDKKEAYVDFSEQEIVHGRIVPYFNKALALKESNEEKAEQFLLIPRQRFITAEESAIPNSEFHEQTLDLGNQLNYSYLSQECFKENSWAYAGQESMLQIPIAQGENLPKPTTREGYLFLAYIAVANHEPLQAKRYLDHCYTRFGCSEWGVQEVQLVQWIAFAAPVQMGDKDLQNNTAEYLPIRLRALSLLAGYHQQFGQQGLRAAIADADPSLPKNKENKYIQMHSDEAKKLDYEKFSKGFYNQFSKHVYDLFQKYHATRNNISIELSLSEAQELSLLMEIFNDPKFNRALPIGARWRVLKTAQSLKENAFLKPELQATPASERKNLTYKKIKPDPDTLKAAPIVVEDFQEFYLDPSVLQAQNITKDFVVDGAIWPSFGKPSLRDSYTKIAQCDFDFSKLAELEQIDRQNMMKFFWSAICLGPLATLEKNEKKIEHFELQALFQNYSKLIKSYYGVNRNPEGRLKNPNANIKDLLQVKPYDFLEQCEFCIKELLGTPELTEQTFLEIFPYLYEFLKEQKLNPDNLKKQLNKTNTGLKEYAEKIEKFCANYLNAHQVDLFDKNGTFNWRLSDSNKSLLCKILWSLCKSPDKFNGCTLVDLSQLPLPENFDTNSVADLFGEYDAKSKKFQVKRYEWWKVYEEKLKKNSPDNPFAQMIKAANEVPFVFAPIARVSESAVEIYNAQVATKKIQEEIDKEKELDQPILLSEESQKKIKNIHMDQEFLNNTDCDELRKLKETFSASDEVIKKTREDFLNQRNGLKNSSIQYIDQARQEQKLDKAMGCAINGAIDEKKEKAKILLKDEKLRENLNKLLKEKCSEIKKSLDQQLTEILKIANSGPPHSDSQDAEYLGWCLEKTAGRLAELSIKDLLTLYLNNSHLDYYKKSRLTEVQRINLHENIGCYVRTKILADQLKRAQKCLERLQDLDVDDNAFKETSYDLLSALFAGKKNSDSDQKDPIDTTIDIFQYYSDLMLREEQEQFLTALLEENKTSSDDKKYRNKVIQLIMGGGKSKVILPILAKKSCDGRSLCMIAVPPALFKTNYADLSKTTRELFKQDANIFLFDRQSDYSASQYKELYNSLKTAMVDRKFYVTTPQSLQSLQLKFIEEGTTKPFQRPEDYKPKPLEDGLKTQLKNLIQKIEAQLKNSTITANKENVCQKLHEFLRRYSDRDFDCFIMIDQTQIPLIDWIKDEKSLPNLSKNADIQKEVCRLLAQFGAPEQTTNIKVTENAPEQKKISIETAIRDGALAKLLALYKEGLLDRRQFKNEDADFLLKIAYENRDARILKLLLSLGFVPSIDAKKDFESIKNKEIEKEFAVLAHEAKTQPNIETVTKYISNKYAGVDEALATHTEWTKKIKWLKRTVQLFKEHCHLIVDEVDTALHVKRMLNYTLGESKPIPSLHIRTTIEFYKFICNIPLDDVLPDRLKNIGSGNANNSKVQSRVTVRNLIASTSDKPSADEWHKIFAHLKECLFEEESSPLKALFRKIHKNTKPQMNEKEVEKQCQEYINNTGTQIPDALSRCDDTALLESLTLYKEQLNSYLPLTMASKKINEHYGVSTIPSQTALQRCVSIPYAGNNTPNNRCKHGDHLETIDYSIQIALINGFSFEAFCMILNQWVAQAQGELLHPASKANGNINETTIGQAFRRLSGEKNNLSEINFKDQQLLTELHQTFNQNKDFLFECLEKVILPQVTVESQTLRSDALNLVSSVASFRGVTGTPDEYHSWHQSIDFDDRNSFGTNGITLDTLEKNNTRVFVQDYNNVKEFLENFIKQLGRDCNASKVRAIIDVGATFRGVTNKDAVRELGQAILGSNQLESIRYILYFDEQDRLYAYDLNTTEEAQRFKMVGSSDAEHIQKVLGCGPESIFTYYDQRHTRGTDIRQMPEAEAICTVSDRSTLTDFVQGAMRMRQLRAGQKIHVVLPTHVASLIKKDEETKPPTINQVSDFCIQNQDNQLLQLHYEGTIGKLMNMIRDDLLDRIMLLDHKDFCAIQAHFLCFEQFLIQQEKTDLYKTRGGIESEVETKTFLENKKDKLLIEWRKRVEDLEKTKDKQDIPQDRKEQLDKEQRTLDQKIGALIQKEVAFCQEKRKELLGATGGSSQKQEQEVEKQKEKEQERETEQEKEQEREQEREMIQEDPKRKPKSRQSVKWFDFGAQEGAAAIAATQINRLVSESFFDPHLYYSLHMQRTLDEQLPDSVIGMMSKPIDAMLISRTSNKEYHTCCLSAEDAEEACQLFKDSKERPLNMWLVTAEGTVIQPRICPTEQKGEDKSLKQHILKIREQVRFLNGNLKALAQQTEAFQWLDQNSITKLDFLQRFTMYRECRSDQFEALKQRLNGAALFLDDVLELYYEDLNHLNDGHDWAEKFHFDFELPPQDVDNAKKVACFVQNLRKLWPKRIDESDVNAVLEGYRVPFMIQARCHRLAELFNQLSDLKKMIDHEITEGNSSQIKEISEMLHMNNTLELCNRFFPPTASSPNLQKPLGYALSREKIPSCALIEALLLAAPGALDETDSQDQGRQAIHKAAQHGSLALINLLKNQGASLLVQDKTGQSAIDYLCEHHRKNRSADAAQNWMKEVGAQAFIQVNQQFLIENALKNDDQILLELILKSELKSDKSESKSDDAWIQLLDKALKQNAENCFNAILNMKDYISFEKFCLSLVDLDKNNAEYVAWQQVLLKIKERTNKDDQKTFIALIQARMESNDWSQKAIDPLKALLGKSPDLMGSVFEGSADGQKYGYQHLLQAFSDSCTIVDSENTENLNARVAKLQDKLKFLLWLWAAFPRLKSAPINPCQKPIQALMREYVVLSKKLNTSIVLDVDEAQLQTILEIMQDAEMKDVDITPFPVLSQAQAMLRNSAIPENSGISVEAETNNNKSLLVFSTDAVLANTHTTWKIDIIEKARSAVILRFWLSQLQQSAVSEDFAQKALWAILSHAAVADKPLLMQLLGHPKPELNAEMLQKILELSLGLSNNSELLEGIATHKAANTQILMQVLDTEQSASFTSETLEALAARSEANAVVLGKILQKDNSDNEDVLLAIIENNESNEATVMNSILSKDASSDLTSWKLEELAARSEANAVVLGKILQKDNSDDEDVLLAIIENNESNEATVMNSILSKDASSDLTSWKLEELAARSEANAVVLGKILQKDNSDDEDVLLAILDNTKSYQFDILSNIISEKGLERDGLVYNKLRELLDTFGADWAEVRVEFNSKFKTGSKAKVGL